MHPPLIGMVGLGLLGSALVERFHRAGHVVAGYDLDPARLAPLKAGGGLPATRLEQLALPVVVLCLPTSDAVDAVLTELLPHLRPGALLVDTTTGDPDRTAAAGARLAASGVRYVDATVAGSSAQARAGEVVV